VECRRTTRPLNFPDPQHPILSHLTKPLQKNRRSK
jgi:hypothetical protein